VNEISFLFKFTNVDRYYKESSIMTRNKKYGQLILFNVCAN